MNMFPDFSQYGYQIQQELGCNRAGGRITYLATAIQQQQFVVLKQFQFARSGASWSDYDTYHREIEILQGLNHPGIPRYLESFQTDDGFCMVQEYKRASSLAISRSFSPDEVKQIALAALDILIYLQNRIPPVIHRDVKPENILVDEQINVYLVDFGFARVGDGDLAVSSVVKGTLGFMPPEQLFNRQLTEASDLYGLGMTLICLLTHTKSDQVGNLVDITYRVSFKHLVPRLSVHWINWLEKMVEPRLKDRFPNAAAALAAIPRSPVRPPEAQFSQSTLTFQAVCVAERLSQTITIRNPVPETTLEGQWEIASHVNDYNSWITIYPESFRSNCITCDITVDTTQLMSGKTYHRQLLLHANTFPSTYSLTLQIQTAEVPFLAHHLPYPLLVGLFLAIVPLTWLLAWVALVIQSIAGTIVGTAVGFQIAAWFLNVIGSRTGASAAVIMGGGIGLTCLLVTGLEDVSVWLSIVLAAGSGIFTGAIAGITLGMAVEHGMTEGLERGKGIVLFLATAVLGISVGLSLTPGFLSAIVVVIALAASLILIGLILQNRLQQIGHMHRFRRSEHHLIRP